MYFLTSVKCCILWIVMDLVYISLLSAAKQRCHDVAVKITPLDPVVHNADESNRHRWRRPQNQTTLAFPRKCLHRVEQQHFADHECALSCQWDVIYYMSSVQMVNWPFVNICYIVFSSDIPPKPVLIGTRKLTKFVKDSYIIRLL